MIQIEHTPNPNAMRFLPGRQLHTQAAQDFPKGTDTSKSPLATQILTLDDIEGVMIGQDFVSVSKTFLADWEILTPKIKQIIETTLKTDEALHEDESDADTQSLENIIFDPKDADLVEDIQELLETRVRPAIAQDGGDMVFRSYDNGIVYLSLHGACAGCPSSSMTLKAGVENLLKYYFPEIQSVEQVL